MTTREEIKSWLKQAKEKGATHVIVMCDTFDYEDYPVSVMPGSDITEEVKRRQSEPMQKIMEVYSMEKDFDMQLAQIRSFNY